MVSGLSPGRGEHSGVPCRERPSSVSARQLHLVQCVAMFLGGRAGAKQRSPTHSAPSSGRQLERPAIHHSRHEQVLHEHLLDAVELQLSQGPCKLRILRREIHECRTLYPKHAGQGTPPVQAVHEMAHGAKP